MNYSLHRFRSPKLIGVVDDAIAFMEETPSYELPPPTQFVGSGVYALYYVGNFPLYARISALNRDSLVQPIYVGKAVPPGWRTARAKETRTPDLYRRLREHSRSVEQARNLALVALKCRFVILADVEADLVVPVEAELIRRHRPLWNAVIGGFGNHDPGSGRYNQARSEWDVLHPGRLWAERLTGVSPTLEQVVANVEDFLR